MTYLARHEVVVKSKTCEDEAKESTCAAEGSSTNFPPTHHKPIYTFTARLVAWAFLLREEQLVIYADHHMKPEKARFDVFVPFIKLYYRGAQL